MGTEVPILSVAYPDSFFTDPDPGIFSNPDPGKKNHIFSKAITKFWEKFLFSTQKVGIVAVHSYTGSGSMGKLLPPWPSG